MRYIIALLLTTLIAQAENSISTQYTSYKYSNLSRNHFVSAYLNLDYAHSFYAGDLDIRLGLNALAVLNKSDDFTLFNTISKNRALIKSLSIDYYPSNKVMLSVGRQSMKLSLLNGNFDGLLAVGKFNDFSIQTFYFKHYSVLYPTYYIDNKIDDLYGININYNKGIFESELGYFKYDDHKVSDIFVALHPDNFTIGIEHLNFTSDTLADEKAYKGYLAYQYDNLYSEIGFYNVYEGTLNHIFDLGASEFQRFRLHGFLDKKEAKNYYVDFIYKHDNFYTNLHFGYTKFEDDWDPTISYTGKEFGITLSKKYNDIEISATIMTQKSDELWEAGERTTWVQTQLKYRF